jgi:hypothetical protein
MEKIDIEKFKRRLAAIERLEQKASDIRDELEEPIRKLIKEAGVGSLLCEKITDIYIRSTEIEIRTETTRGDFDTNYYKLPLSILKADDPMIAAAEYKRRKASAADDARRARTLAEIERLKRSL